MTLAMCCQRYLVPEVGGERTERKKGKNGKRKSSNDISGEEEKKEDKFGTTNITCNEVPASQWDNFKILTYLLILSNPNPNYRKI